MKEYYKEKLKVDLDLFKLFISVIVVLSAGLGTLFLNRNFGESIAELTLFVSGCVFLSGLFILIIVLYFEIRKDLKEIKK